MAWPSIESVWAASCGRASARIATIPLTRELVPPSFRDVWLLRESRHFLTAVLCQLTNVRECHSLYPLAPLCDNVRSSCERFSPSVPCGCTWRRTQSALKPRSHCEKSDGSF